MKVESVFDEMQRLIGPYCWGMPDVTPIHGLSGLPFQLDVGVVLKASNDAASPAEARAALFDAAQKAITAVEEAGYRHYQAPDIRIAGDIGGLDKPDGPVLVADGRLSLNLWRPAEEQR